MTAAVALLLFLAQDPEALSARALEAAQQKQFGEAETLWKQALAIDPSLFSANFNLGFLLMQQARNTDAEPFLARAVRTKPSDFNARYVLGSVLAQLGKSDDALRQWRAALAMRPDHARLMQVMAVEYGKGRYFREAAAVAEKALSIDDKDPAAWLIAIKSWQDADEHASALRLAERMVKRFPNHARAAFEYGYELYRAGRPEDAIGWVRTAMDASPPWEEPFFFYGDILLRQGNAAEAIAPLKKAIEIRRDYTAASVTLARALMSLGRFDDAVKELTTASQVDPRHPQPHLLLSQVYFRLGNEEAAAREKALSLKLRRENPTALESPQSRPFPSK